MGINELKRSTWLPKNAHLTQKGAGCARARTRCKFVHLKQVAINVKLRNFALFCLALCLADTKQKAQRVSDKPLKTMVPPERLELPTH